MNIIKTNQEFKKLDLLVTVHYSCEKQSSEYYPYYEYVVDIHKCECMGTDLTNLIFADDTAFVQINEELCNLNRLGKKLFAEVDVSLKVPVEFKTPIGFEI